MTAELFVAVPLIPEVRSLIASRRDALFNETGRALPLAEIVRAAEGARVLIVSPRDRMDAEAIAALPASVEILGTYSVGYEHIDLAAARARGLRVLHTPDVLTDAVAETAMLLMFGAARRAHESAELLRSGAWAGWNPTELIGLEVTGKRMGIYGFGRIGQRIARRARGFDMEIHYRGPRRKPPEQEQGATFHADDASFLPLCDVLVLACPVTAETRGLLNAERIALLPRHAIVVNIARGAVVDDDALIAALRERRIFAAGLDVFNNEPNLDPRYLDLPNACLMPHIGSSTMTARLKMAESLLDSLDAIDRGDDSGVREVTPSP